MKIKIPCERCMNSGIVDRSCQKCSGNGVHNKTIKVWKVAPKTVTIEDIDRASKDSFYKGTQTSYEGGLRYWINMGEFYNEKDKYLHFSKEDAQAECDKRNKDISDILNVVNKNKSTNDKRLCDDTDFEHLIKLERAKSNYWKLKANGEDPLLFGSADDIKYITS